MCAVWDSTELDVTRCMTENGFHRTLVAYLFAEMIVGVLSWHQDVARWVSV